jgi:hypothetical protein
LLALAKPLRLRPVILIKPVERRPSRVDLASIAW